MTLVRDMVEVLNLVLRSTFRRPGARNRPSKAVGYAQRDIGPKRLWPPKVSVLSVRIAGDEHENRTVGHPR